MPRARKHAKTALAVELNKTYLWGELDDVPYPIALCVLDAAPSPLYCSAPLAEQVQIEVRAAAARSATGQHRWSADGAAYISAYRELFLQGRFDATGWTVVVSQPEHHALAPARVVRDLVLPAGLLTVLAAALLAVMQVQRTMGPLQVLTAATKRIAAREFGTRVAIARDDEFGELGRAFDAMSDHLGHQFDALSTLAQIDAVILKQLDIDRIVAILLARLTEGVRADWHCVLLAETGNKANAADANSFRVHTVDMDLRLPARLTLSPEDVARLLAFSDALQRDTVDFLRAAHFPLLAEHGFFALPVVLESRLAGLIVIGYRGAREPSEIEQRLMRDLGDRLAVALATAARDRKLQHQAHFDALTGLPNRMNFMETLGRELARAERRQSLFGVLFVDLDGFSSVNDTLGHAAGDELLVQAAARLRGCLRKHDVVARLGGDEFTVMLSDLRDANDAATASRHVIHALSQPFKLAHAERYIAASVGVALYPANGTTAEALLRNADMAMYRAKERGRGMHVFYEEAMNLEAQQRAQLDRELRRALNQGEFTLYFQPQLDMRSSRIVGAEALVRWQHPERGLVPPGQFIAVAESIGLIEPIGAWVLREACTRFVAWQAAGMSLDHISVNVSPRQFRHRNFPELVEEALRATGMPPERLQLEITEGVLVEESGSADATLAQLVRMGVRLAIDDFGTGYSSLAYLKHLPVGTIKLDRSFIRDIAVNDDARAIARSAIAMVQALRKQIVAEGVETAEQLSLLEYLGCDATQGYYLGRPMPEAEFLQFVRQGVAAPRLKRTWENVTQLAPARG
jgi:diguanylate cyclase (GGDEF)-like protein